jgi:glycolate oxidase FAD binding subunit
MQPDTEGLIAGLSEVVGKDAVGVCHGPSVAGIEPRVEATPHTIDEAARVLTRAAEAGATIFPCGGGTKLALGNPPSRVDLLLRTSALDRTVEYDAENLVITVEAGTTIDEVQSRVAGDGLFLPIDPALPWQATVGGVLACNVHGPKRLSYGSLRDLLLGIKVVLTDGEIVRFGGRTIKNVSGYDLSKLFIGSLGTLGVMAEATFRLMPTAAREQVALVSLAGLQEASRLSDLISGSVLLPSALEVLSPRFGGLVLGKRAVDAVGAGDTQNHLFLMGFEGHSKAVARQAEGVGGFCSQISASGAVFLDSDDSSAADSPQSAWQAIARAPEIMTAAGYGVSAHVTVPKSDIWSIAQQAENESGSESVAVDYRISCGIGTAELWFKGEADAVVQALRLLRSSAEKHGGALILNEGWAVIGQGFDGWGEPRDDYRLIRSIKTKFDPGCLLNPGRFVGGL